MCFFVSREREVFLCLCGAQGALACVGGPPANFLLLPSGVLGFRGEAGEGGRGGQRALGARGGERGNGGGARRQRPPAPRLCFRSHPGLSLLICVDARARTPSSRHRLPPSFGPPPPLLYATPTTSTLCQISRSLSPRRRRRLSRLPLVPPPARPLSLLSGDATAAAALQSHASLLTPQPCPPSRSRLLPSRRSAASTRHQDWPASSNCLCARSTRRGHQQKQRWPTRRTGRPPRPSTCPSRS